MFAGQADGLQVVGHARCTIDDADFLRAEVAEWGIVDDVADLRKTCGLKPVETRRRLESGLEREPRCGAL